MSINVARLEHLSSGLEELRNWIHAQAIKEDMGNSTDLHSRGSPVLNHDKVIPPPGNHRCETQLQQNPYSTRISKVEFPRFDESKVKEWLYKQRSARQRDPFEPGKHIFVFSTAGGFDRLFGSTGANNEFDAVSLGRFRFLIVKPICDRNRPNTYTEFKISPRYKRKMNACLRNSKLLPYQTLAAVDN